MTVQNDNTVLSKGDLKAYHQRILPYLGGNNMVRTNNSDFFSTEEKVVGVWTNGKPIYQKTIFVNQDLAANAGYQVSSIQNIEEIINHKYKMSWQNMSSGITRIVDDAWTDLTNGYTDIYLRNGNFELRNTFAMGLFWITVQYTKTTDTITSALTTPGAYDLTRPDLWPQNKEIFFGDGLYGYRATGNVPSNKDVAISNVSGATRFIACGGTVDNGAGANFHSFNYTNPSAMPTWGTCLFANHNSGVPEIYFGTGYTTSSVYDVWFTYKK